MEEEVTPTNEVAEDIQEFPADEPELEPKPKEEGGEEVPPTDQPPKKKTAQERIDEITKARRTAEREAEYWRKLALDKAEQPPKEPPRQPNDRPKLEQFNSTEEYEDALIEWHDRKKEQISQAKEIERQERDARAKFNKNAKALREEYEDFDDVINEPVFTPNMREVLMNSDNGPVVAYFLGKPENRETAERIMSMPPSMQTYELGKIETTLLIAKKTTKPPGAPPPIKPIGPGGTPPVDESKLSDDEWYELEKKRRMEKLQKQYGGK